MSSHLTEAELAQIAVSDRFNPYAALASTAPSTNHARKMKPFSQWKERVHFSAQDALDVVELSSQGVSKAEIARRKGCHPAYVAAIMSGKQWSKVTGIKP
jgi:hypothetical protein